MNNKYTPKQKILMGIVITVVVALVLAASYYWIQDSAIDDHLERIRGQLPHELEYIAPISIDSTEIDIKLVKLYEGIISYEFYANTLTNNEGAVPNEIGVTRIKGILHEDDEGEYLIARIEEADSQAPLYIDEDYDWFGVPIEQKNNKTIEIVTDQVPDETIMTMLNKIANSIDDSSVMVSQIKTTKELKGTLTYTMEAFTDYYGTIQAVTHVAKDGYHHLEYIVAEYDIDDPDYTNRKNLLFFDSSYRVSANNGKTPEQTQPYNKFD